MKESLFLLFTFLFTLLGCQSNTERGDSLFQQIPSAHSGVDFANIITETDSFNVLNYEYIYNGSGVGIGDFNLDGLPDLFFAGNMVSSRLYLNRGEFQFEDVTVAAGVTTDAWCTGVAICDINQDGWPDIHVSTAHDNGLNAAANYFFINKTKPGGEVLFENLASEMGLADDSYTVQAVFLDYDKDQDLDIFLINNSMEIYPRNRAFGQKKDGSGKSTDRLYENKGMNEKGVPIFEDVSQQAGILIEGWSLGVKVMDFNQDSYPDIYVANDFLSNDLLYINNKDGTFSNQITDYFKHQSHNSMGIDAADLNNDGANDLVVLDMLPEDNLRKKTMFESIPFDRFNESLRKDYQPQFVRNVLQAQNSNGTFSEIGYYSGIAATDWSWSPLLADFDNDGLRDLYVTNGYKKDITDLDFVNYNTEASTFGSAEERRERLIRQLNEMEGVKKSNRFFMNKGQYQFHDETADSGLEIPSYSNGAAYADLDLDGDLDLVTNNMNDAAFVFENRLNAKRNFLRIKLVPDAQSFGAKVWIYMRDQLQYAEFYPQLGYLSNMEPVLHFGLDSLSIIDSLKIVWPDQSIYRIDNIPANQLLEIDARKVARVKPDGQHSWNVAFAKTALTQQNLIPYQHKETTFNDFKTWPLHFRSYSKPGPVLASGDINGDNLEDLFVGGSAQQNGRFFLQTQGGQFRELLLNDSLGRMSEDVGAVLFDADGDGDLDLYCVSGSSEFYAHPELYQDRYYENNGLGVFTLRLDKIPEIRTAGSCVVPLDYDQDGDLDLFVGGRLIPNQYPYAPRSFLLQNNNGSFKDITQSIAPDLMHPGMVTDVQATDLNLDGWTDLLVVGEWMPLQIYYNREGKFVLDKSENGLALTNGWWNCVESGDFDGDGDFDFLAGNWGLNNPFEASPTAPLSIYAKDYDSNGDIEALMTYFNQGKEYIFHPRGTLTSQLPGIKRLFPDYRSYGKATFDMMFPNVKFNESEIVRAYQLASVYVENLGNGQFSIRQLPTSLQWSPIFDFLPTDINDDGLLDMLAIGNYNDTEVLTGWYNAGNGYCLINKGKGAFSIMENQKSGFTIPGEGRSMLAVPYVKGGMLYIIGVQGEGIMSFLKEGSKYDD